MRREGVARRPLPLAVGALSRARCPPHSTHSSTLTPPCQNVDGEPETGGRKKIGAFLVQNQLQARWGAGDWGAGPRGSGKGGAAGADSWVCGTDAGQLVGPPVRGLKQAPGPRRAPPASPPRTSAPTPSLNPTPIYNPTPRLPPPQTSVYSSALFLTSGAQNLLVVNLAAKMGAAIPDVWMTWFIGCLPQAVLGMLITPLLLYKQYPPEVGGLRLCCAVRFALSCLLSPGVQHPGDTTFPRLCRRRPSDASSPLLPSPPVPCTPRSRRRPRRPPRRLLSSRRWAP